MSWLFFIIVFGYALVILLLSKEMLTYSKTEFFSGIKKNSFSIIINYRNEEHHLPQLLDSIRLQNYDFTLLQWIFINDNSTDQSLLILRSFKDKHPEINLELMDRIPNSASSKKDGITQAIPLCKHHHVITTDADCILPRNWITSYNAIYHKHTDAHFIAAPVQIKEENTILSNLQQQEMIALQLITAGSFSFNKPFMCNGANMSFTKTAFKEVEGYKGNDHISSGDDIFLLEKLAIKDIMKCHYLKNKEAVVTTFPKRTWKEAISQRARWAQKGSETKSLLNKLVSFQVLLMSLLFITSPILYLSNIITTQMFLGLLITKTFTDFIVLIIGNEFFENIKWKYTWSNFLIYPFLVILIAIKSLSKSPWQGRKINVLTSR